MHFIERFNGENIDGQHPMIIVENCLDICFPIVYSLTSPLIMYSEFVWSNLIWPVKCQSWPENV